MATFTVDLISGKVFLFDKDFGESTGGTLSTTYPEVNTFPELPDASLNNGRTFLVRTSIGKYILNRKESGLYFSNGSTWRRLGDIPSFFDSENFQILDNGDNSKGIEFETSGITTNTLRKLKIQDSDGVIAYLSDLDVKVDKSVFNDYTGNTVPNTYLSINSFNSYSAETFTLIQNKQDKLIAGSGIKISGNTISVNLPKTIQIKNSIGGIEVNTINRKLINWDENPYVGDYFIFTGGSRIYIQETGDYELSYQMNIENTTTNKKNIGSLIVRNSIEDITPTSSTSYIVNSVNNIGSNSLSNYKLKLTIGDYVELSAFRIGSSGNAITIPDGCWLKIIRII